MSRFHLSLDVSDLDRSAAFFRLLLGCDPAKLKPDYAKFEPADPAIVLSLEKRPTVTPGRLDHAGLRVQTAEQLVAVQRRLEEGGVRTVREDGDECCCARQTKFWAPDPDGRMWEVYVLESDTPTRGPGTVPLSLATSQKCCD